MEAAASEDETYITPIIMEYFWKKQHLTDD